MSRSSKSYFHCVYLAVQRLWCSIICFNVRINAQVVSSENNISQFSETRNFASYLLASIIWEQTDASVASYRLEMIDQYHDVLAISGCSCSRTHIYHSSPPHRTAIIPMDQCHEPLETHAESFTQGTATITISPCQWRKTELSFWERAQTRPRDDFTPTKSETSCCYFIRV